MQMSIGHRIRAARDRSGLTQAQLAAHLSVSRAAVAQWETGASDPALEKIALIARALRVTPDFLLTGAGAGMAPATPPATGPQSTASPATPQTTDVPLVGSAGAAALEDGFFVLNGQIVDYVRRPPGIAHNRAAFALHVRGDSMAPRFEEGDLIYLDPHRPARLGDFVLVELVPDRAGDPGVALLKRLVGRSASKLTLAQYNPAREFDIAADRVQRVVAVLSLSDLIGN